MNRLFVCAALVLALLAEANAHDGHSHDRSQAVVFDLPVWRDAAGRVLREGSFVTARESEVIVQDRLGDVVAIELDTLGETERDRVGAKLEAVRQINSQSIHRTATSRAIRSRAVSGAYLKVLQRTFGAFAPKVKTRTGNQFFFVESNSIPDHQMMVGITAWQQQVPIPQPYMGANAWQIPLHPVLAASPMSAKEHFFRGAIALAVNGVPIFNPIKNDGRTDTLLAGELDKWGGHCGRADDYHYHLAPTHLQAQVGAGSPVAFALDGYPVYGFAEPDGSPVGGLDWMGGHVGRDGHYHYHALKKYPYLIGGFRGQVREVGGQVDPQPRARGVRPDTRPLRGAKITGFEGDLKSGFSLKYSQYERDGFVNYRVLGSGNVTFHFIDTIGRRTTETFEPRRRGRGEERGRGRGDRGRGRPRREGAQTPPRDGGDRRPPRQTVERPEVLRVAH